MSDLGHFELTVGFEQRTGETRPVGPKYLDRRLAVSPEGSLQVTAPRPESPGDRVDRQVWPDGLRLDDGAGLLVQLFVAYLGRACLREGGKCEASVPTADVSALSATATAGAAVNPLPPRASWAWNRAFTAEVIITAERRSLSEWNISSESARVM